MEKDRFKIVHLGHLGVGSIFGMTPKGQEQTEYNKWLREKWDYAKDEIGKADVLVLGGEIIEGFNKKGYGEDIWLVRIEDQMDASISLIEEWIDRERTKEILVLYSHQYHSIDEMRIENLIAKRLASAGYNAVAGKMFLRNYQGDHNMRFWHGSSGAFVYKASGKEREIKFNLENSALEKTPKIDCLYTYHSHQLFGANFSGIQGLGCPCFKLLDTYGELKHPDAWQPDLGLMVTTFQERFGEIRVDNDAMIFRHNFRFDELEQAMKEHKEIAEMKWEKVRSAQIADEFGVNDLKAHHDEK